MPSFKERARAAWGAFTRAMHWFGDRVSDLLFFVLYFTLFALVAIPYRVFARRALSAPTAYRPAPSPMPREGFTDEW